MTRYNPHEPTPKQSAFLWLDCISAFYGGAVGGGKSDCLLMAALQYVDIPGYHAILIRDTYKNLTEPGALATRAEEWLTGTDARWSDKKWHFPSGATLSFGYLDGPRDHFNFQSSEFLFVGIDEIVNIRERQAKYMFSRLRKKDAEAYKKELLSLPKYRNLSTDQVEEYYKQYANIPLRFRCASNPPTREQIARGAWVKTAYVDPSTRDKGAVFIPAWMSDNPYLDKKTYKKSLEQMDAITRAQLEKGDWEIRTKGTLFDRSWFEFVDAVPEGARRLRYWDLAATQDSEDQMTESRGKKKSARTAGALLAVKDKVVYIEDMVKFKKSPLGVEKMIRQIAEQDGRSVPIRMEQEPGSSGVNTITHYQTSVLPDFNFKGRKKTSDKVAEASVWSAQAENGYVKIVRGPWNKDFLEEAELFPDSEYKDQIDAVSGAYLELRQSPIVRIRSV